jgi:integrase
MGFRRYQRGSVFKRGKRGQYVWYGMWREDVPNPDGGSVRRQRCVRLGTIGELPTRSMAYERLSNLMGQKPSMQLTFSDLAERWRAAVVPTIKESTATYYRKMLKAHVVPAFGKCEVSSITRYDVETFLADRAKLFCRNTLRGMRVSLGRVLSWAVDCGWLEKNPCGGVKLPLAGSKVKRTILTPEQVAAIVNRLHEPYATLVLFLAVSGLRIGEAIAVKWSDFEGDILNIRRRIYEGEVGTTKTESSERGLPIPAPLLERMKKLGDGEWIFRARNGAPINPKNAAHRYIRPLVRELGIEIGGWHDFRHTLSTRLLKDYPTKVVSELLGHSDVGTTLKTYHHVHTEDFRAPLNEVATELLASVSKRPVLQQSVGTNSVN